MSKAQRQAVIDFITDNYGCTKTDVIKYMEKSSVHAAMMTTREILSNLIDEEIVIVEKVNSQIHRLHLNTKTRFYWILEQISNMRLTFYEHPNSKKTKDLLSRLTLLRLAETQKYIKNDDDKQLLTQKIIDLMLEYNYKKPGLWHTI
jgi:hypothetical protein